MGKISNRAKSEYAIQTVTNALRMLEVFDTEPEIGVSDVARRLGLHKNNAFRLLATLELRGYIEQDPATELYSLGPRCLELGHAFARSHPLMKLARPILEELAQAQGETAHLGVLSGAQVVHLDGVLPDQLVLTALRVGQRIDAHCTALGKILLSGRMERRASGGASVESTDSEAFIGSSLKSHTESTVVDTSKLMDEIRMVGLRGYATDLEECGLGLHCVAAPVRNASSNVVAAVSLSGPTQRLDEERLHGPVAEAVVAAAARLSVALGSPA